jgi:SAM-dependent methyltransferase
MLAEHLSQQHDAASRRFPKISAQVAWIHRELLGERPCKILDLCCGPGLYTSRFARLGHKCVGIDYAPASIAYAVRLAHEQELGCIYLQEDVRQARYGTGYGLAMLVHGEFNTFHPSDARNILSKAHAALAPGGVLLLEPMRAEAVERWAKSGTHWRTAPKGLFSDRPHLYLEEQFWDEPSRTHTTRYFVVDAATGQVDAHASTQKAYSRDDLRELLAECGLHSVQFYPSLVGVPDESQSNFFVAVAQK